MRWTRRAPMVLGIAVFLSSAAPAFAGTVVLAPPGHPGASQYVEVIPTSAGNAAPPGTVRGSGTASAGPQALTDFGHGRKGDAGLARLGKEGQAAAALAASTAPVPVTSANGRSGSASAASSAAQGGSPAGGVADALTGSDSGGLGLLLPLLLATALVVGVGVFAAGMRRRPRSAGT